MKNLCKAFLAVAVAAAAFSPQAQAQTVVLNGLGSSAMFLELGLAASSSTAGTINAPCVWSENTSTAWASDTQATNLDKGNAWVAWTKGSDGTCATAGNIYAYLQTDSVVGNRCIFDGSCTMNYSSAAGTAPAGLILGTSSEVTLPSTVASLLNTAPNFAGTDIRPEDAAFATLRATTPCGSVINSSYPQYLGLGYASGNTIVGWTPDQPLLNPQGGAVSYSPSSFNVVNYTLPTSGFTVTSLGAVPVVVVANSNSATGINQISNITSSNLAKLLDGTYSTSSDVGGTGTQGIYVFVREPLSGTYNTMEYNVPNTTTNKTSQDVGLNQLSSQVNCNGAVPLADPITGQYIMEIPTASGGARYRAIGTGNDLKVAEYYKNASGLMNNLGYGFWSVANYAGFTSTLAPNAKYLKVDGVDPLISSSKHYDSGKIPVSGSSDMQWVDLGHVADGTYPIWSMLRLVANNPSSSVTTAINSLQGAVQQYVTFSSATSRPDFVPVANMSVVRSHFTPPGVTFTLPLNNGGTCGTESGGDVGGVVLPIGSCSTGQRR